MSKEYYKTDEKTVNFEDSQLITQMYSKGYVFTRLGRGNMIQTRSVRINVENFQKTSENKRILRKTENLIYQIHDLPYEDYSWEIHKLGKVYYSQKFGRGTMSASKIKSMFTDTENENMTSVFVYESTDKPIEVALHSDEQLKTYVEGYALCYQNNQIIHYAYPFYDLESPIKNLGMGMMLRAIIWAQDNNKKYIYLGSAVDSSAKYKLQFKGLEWWDNDNGLWNQDLDKLKHFLK